MAGLEAAELAGASFATRWKSFMRSNAELAEVHIITD
jgi:hypothetical protein